jgi:SAM-dependent methyltransferase
MKDFATYYDNQFSESTESGSIYEPFTVLLEAAHDARMTLLDRLPLGDLSDKVVVDFGTGSWGFACVFPRLHQCRLAIGIDISAQAIAMSAEISRKGQYPYADRYKYLVSDGITVPLADSFADVFFAGESIEHVENTDAFLDEIYRVLKPDGILILTTPNPRPWLYRTLGLEYAVGPEHISLMDYEELKSYLEPRFDVLSWQGYNSSLHPSIDDKVVDVDFARTWALASIADPRDACGFVVSARAKAGHKPKAYTKMSYRFTSETVRSAGSWTEMKIHKDLTTHMTKAGGKLSIDFRGDQLILLFWTHDWSGIAEITVDGESQQIDLFSQFAGFKRVVFQGLGAGIEHNVVIAATGKRNPRSFDDQILFFTASTFMPKS